MKKNLPCIVKAILFASALFFGAVDVFAAPQEAAQKPPAKAQGRNMADYELFFEAVDAIKGRYVTEPEQKKLIRDAIAGMAMGLDPFSRYVASKDAEDEESYIEGSYIGIGVEVAMREEGLEVVTPIEGGSAKLAGIASGDLIEEINGDQVAEMGYDEAIERLKGPEDTKVTLGVRRGQSQELKIVTLTRRRVEMKSVYLQEAQGAFIIRLTSFQRSTAEELRSMLAKISASRPKSGVIIDLRDNPGGLIDQAVKAADLFLKKGKIVYTKGRDERENALYLARDDKSEPSWPLLALVNRGSASAAELFSGALKDRGRALVAGERTFGKGSVQSIIDLSDGGFLRITTALYYTPSGVSIHKNGIAPDVELKASPAELKDFAERSESAFTGYDLEKDGQLKAALALLASGKCPKGEKEAE